MFRIGTPVGNHHPDFTATTGTADAHARALTTAKVMAETAVDLMENAAAMEAAQQEFTSLEIDIQAAKANMIGGRGVEGGVLGFWTGGEGIALNDSYAAWVPPN